MMLNAVNVDVTGIMKELLAAQYTCSCGAAVKPEAAYNEPLDELSSRTAREDLAGKVRCAKTAVEIAGRAGKKPSQYGSGVFPLVRTLQRLAEAEAKRRARRQEQERRLRDYAEQYRAAPVFDETGAFKKPTVRILRNGELTCGLPDSVGCCRHDRTAERFLTVKGEDVQVVGICGAVGWVFSQIRKGHEKDADYRALAFTKDPNKAREIAEMVRERMFNPLGGRIEERKPSPLNNVTDPAKRARWERNRAEKADRNQQASDALTPNQGSGLQGAAKFKKGKK